MLKRALRLGAYAHQGAWVHTLHQTRLDTACVKESGDCEI